MSGQENDDRVQERWQCSVAITEEGDDSRAGNIAVTKRGEGDGGGRDDYKAGT